MYRPSSVDRPAKRGRDSKARGVPAPLCSEECSYTTRGSPTVPVRRPFTMLKAGQRPFASKPL